MRVTFVTTGLGTGGAETALLRLLPAMRTFGIDSSVVSLRTEGHVGPLLRAAEVPVAALGLPAARSMFVALSDLLAQVRRHNADLVHGWMYHGNLAASAAARVLHVKTAWGIRQSLGLGTRDKWLTRRVIQLGARLSRRADLIVYNSNAARQQHEARGYARHLGTVVPNGFDTSLFRPDGSLRTAVRVELGIDANAVVVAQVGRYHVAKDYPSFVKAAGLIAARFPSAKFLLVGEGVDESNAELRRMIDEVGLKGRARLLGRRTDVGRLMTAFDVLCLTSSGMEGFPNVVGEAMSCGVPCVGTAVGDVAELIGDAGIVVAPSDPDAMAAAVGRLLSLPDVTRVALGARARQRIVEAFSIEQVARRYADLMLRTLSSARRRD
jgi:glycosyltransferase involved in cell wall biosynthesis